MDIRNFETEDDTVPPSPENASNLTKDGEVCWSDPLLAEGASGETTSDKGEKIMVKRTAYVPLTM